MKLELVRYICLPGGGTFEAPELPEYSYGEFLMRTSLGETAYLNALADATYKEVTQLVREHPRARTLDDNARAEIVQRHYGELACDPSPSGSVYVLGAKPPCPAGAHQHIASWEFTGRSVEVVMPAVSHTYWFSLSARDKRERLEQFL